MGEVVLPSTDRCDCNRTGVDSATCRSEHGVPTAVEWGYNGVPKME